MLKIDVDDNKKEGMYRCDDGSYIPFRKCTQCGKNTYIYSIFGTECDTVFNDGNKCKGTFQLYNKKL